MKPNWDHLEREYKRAAQELYDSGVEYGGDMHDTFNEMPFGECPYCHHKWQLDDWYELDADDSLDCPRCERNIVILEVSSTTTMTFGVTEEEKHH